jgi:uncharacterized YigZ family protein
MSGVEDSYFTIDNPCKGLYKDKGSKFISYLIPVKSDESFKSQLDLIKSNEPNARHYCWASRIGYDVTEERSNDDGEPGHTAGTPILRELQSAELVNVACVVVRYFGGTKLGVPGLINAYSQATLNAVGACSIERKWIQQSISITFSYEQISFVERICKQLDAEIVKRKQDFNLTYEVEIKRSKLEALIEQLETNHLLHIARL